LAFVTLGGAALAAFLQEDLRHAVGYLVIADGGLVLLGFAALDPAAWGPARTWLVVLAASKTALAAWAAVAEARFETRSLPDLRGWVRRSPILAAALALTAVATFGLPGWIVFEARGDLARLAAGAPWDALLILAGFLTLPAYLRLLALGVGPPSSRVARAAPERITRAARRAGTLDVEVEVGGGPGVVAPLPTSAPARGPAGALGGRVTAVLRRDRTELISAAVLAIAVLAALTSWGALDIGGAAGEPAPIVSGPAAD
jgi:NADH:ubiquinone oxidoreductase subunit 5 (subunit L)/multisubunit Na+/H+ antiporter MnhA subunit